MKKGARFSSVSSHESETISSELIEDDQRRLTIVDERLGSVFSDNARSTSEIEGFTSNFYKQLIAKRRGQARQADICDSMSQDRPNYVRAGSELDNNRSFGSEADRFLPQIDRREWQLNQRENVWDEHSKKKLNY